jgi:hypothetical protein
MFILSSIFYIISFVLYEFSFIKESLFLFIMACVAFITSIHPIYLPDKLVLGIIGLLTTVTGCLLIASIVSNDFDTLFALIVTGSVTNVLIVYHFKLWPILNYCISYNLGFEIFWFIYQEMFLPSLFINVVILCITFVLLFNIQEFRDRFLCVFKPLFYVTSVCLILAGLIMLSVDPDKSIGIRLVLTGFLFFSIYYSKEEIKKIEGGEKEEEEEFIEV